MIPSSEGMKGRGKGGRGRERRRERERERERERDGESYRKLAGGVLRSSGGGYFRSNVG